MLLRPARLGAGTIVVGLAVALALALALVPAANASASIEKSSVCKAYKSEETTQTKGSANLAKEMESGKWSSIKGALLATFTGEANAEKQFAGYLSGASAKVKAAAAVALKLNSTFKTIIENSSSLQQFETRITAAESTPKVTAALKVLESYSKTICS
jgi:hypothetical protein